MNSSVHISVWINFMVNCGKGKFKLFTHWICFGKGKQILQNNYLPFFSTVTSFICCTLICSGYSSYSNTMIC